jgi:hypothetical protein
VTCTGASTCNLGVTSHADASTILCSGQNTCLGQKLFCTGATCTIGCDGGGACTAGACCDASTCNLYGLTSSCP